MTLAEIYETTRRRQFWIDVGGTFTDCVSLAPDGELETRKVLSTGVMKGTARQVRDSCVCDSAFGGFTRNFFAGYRLRFSAVDGESWEVEIAGSTSEGELDLSQSLPEWVQEGSSFELSSGEPAPIVAMRLALGKRLDEPLGAVDVRLGTTRATNALLERQGARTLFVTTRGFADVLRIANQDRPKLFDLHIRKPEELFEGVLEASERIAADGAVIEALDEARLRAELDAWRERGVESVAICFLNAWRNPEHERRAGEIAREAGFAQVSVSTELSPTIKMVSRGDTAVVDAYLTPVVREYVERIAALVPEGNLRIMTSAGGLLRAEALHGKDCILSGPAGGVVGFSGVARAAGFEKSIGFDMGGTSTDVSRFDGDFAYEYETKKAGVRIVAPMLAIETVAAGGGSICAFDGQKLVVGPRSAGAEPGPACYGRGGPLAVTDLNVYLGRLQPDFFPFQLDRAAVEARLGEVSEAIERATGKRMEARELAEGFLRIANASMAAPIKKISVERGYDIRDYALVSFGGAAGQHACAVAGELGMRRILIHRFAGVLSAYGMGLADVRKFGSKTVLLPLDGEGLAEVEGEFRAMAEELRAEVEAEGVGADQISAPRRQLDLRYAGQSSAITIDEPEGGDGGDGGARGADGDAAAWRREFEQMHRQLYGHVFEGRAVEIVAARVQVIGRTFKPEAELVEEVEREPEAAERREVIFGGRVESAGLYRWDELRPGDRIAGPALVLESTSTVVVEPGWRARFSGWGDLVLEASETSSRESEARTVEGAREEAVREEASAEVDPIRLEIFNNHFMSIAEQMGATLQRTALSTNVKERLDFSCAIFTAEGDLVANAPHVPVHLGAMSDCVKYVLRDVPDLAPGDVIVTNDPLRGGSHLPDVTAVTPVYDEAGERLLFFTASRAHHAEIGGIRPGSIPPESKNLAEEGVLLRHVKAVARGEARLEELRRLLEAGPWPSRAPEENVADISAQIAANHRGAEALAALLGRFGTATTLAYMGHIQTAAANKMRASLRAFGDGVYEFADALDDGTPIEVSIEIREGEATLDFVGTGPVHPGNLNANRAIVNSAVIYCFRCMIGEEIPLNAGVLEPLRIVLPEGLLNPPMHEDPAQCPAVVGGNVETSQRIVDVILGALGLAAASQGTMNNLIFGNERFGYYETICGGAGAGPGFDGADAVHTHMTNTRLTDPEMLEAYYPVRLVSFGIRRGSGGRGKWRGGDGVRREFEFLAPLQVSVLSQRRTRRAYGLAGGEPGEAGRNGLARKDEARAETLPSIASVDVRPGDRIVLETPGGGGYGRAGNG